ncbi:hypothetical protein, partial [Leptospira kirschneri]|uniref:hypothetical protein n=1 Tax=Leptospira kirschneri TaxID=29507 RepID=UPI001E47F9B4
ILECFSNQSIMRIIHFGHLLSFEFNFIKSILFRTDLKLQKRIWLVRKNKVCSEFMIFTKKSYCIT